MLRLENRRTLVNPRFEKFTNYSSVIRGISIILSGLVFSGSLGFTQPVRADSQQPKSAVLNETKSPHPHSVDADFVELREYARQIGSVQPSLANAGENQSPHYDNTDFAALREYVQQIGPDQPNSSSAPRFRIAKAGSALGALREFLQKGAEPGPAPNSAPGGTPKKPIPTAPEPNPSFTDAHRLGSETCLFCHARQAESFGQTLMGRIGKTQPAKFACENCHGPGSAHVQAVGCAACHGESGISKKPGIPSLAGQDPQYLIPAMKAYITGQRKHDLMKTVLSGVGEAELNNIAQYYARQIPARAQTPSLADPSAGRAATALCAGCHGERGVSVYPGWPSLAGQDAQYLAGAIKAYQDGSRRKSVACAGCHGESGISRRPGIPSLVGLSPQYLISAMKTYVAGQRKHGLMKALLSNVSEAELNDIALYYAQQTPTRAETPPFGDPSAGKTTLMPLTDFPIAASAVCAGCHGQQGVSVNPIWPSLAGQDARYLADALKAYKDGSRDNAMMKGFAAPLDDKTINDIASHFASLPPAKPSLPGGPQAPAAKHAPVLIRNGLVASLDDRTIKNVASYYASLLPEPRGGARNTPARGDPILVSMAVRSDGSSPGGIVSFRKNDPSRKVAQNNAICLGCHERGDRTYWNGSTHETRGLACTECHTVMRPISRKSALKTEIEMETCFQCHKDRRAQIFRSAHMPLREGKITCSNCHNPHGSATEALLKENSINDTCYKCHAEKRGPFLFEHAPVRENCLSCHDAHGSNTEYMLKVSRPRLCAECHGMGHGSLTNGPRTVETFGRACQNCHTAIHGSNSPSGALLQR
jgi:DmsE family decaheme c-type cytochrome